MKSNQSKQTKPSSKDSEIEEVNHLDNDKELREQVLDILRFPNNKKPERFTIATQIRNKQSEDLLEIIDQYTQSKLKAFAGETLESVFAGLPNGCVLKTPNAYNTTFTCTYKEHTRYSIKVAGKTPTEAVVKMAQALAFKQHLTKKEES